MPAPFLNDKGMKWGPRAEAAGTIGIVSGMLH